MHIIVISIYHGILVHINPSSGLVIMTRQLMLSAGNLVRWKRWVVLPQYYKNKYIIHKGNFLLNVKH